MGLGFVLVHMNARERVRGNQRGASLVEMAMVLPLLIIVLVGTLEIGAAFRDFLTTSHAVREGRLLRRSQPPCNPPPETRSSR